MSTLVCCPAGGRVLTCARAVGWTLFSTLLASCSFVLPATQDVRIEVSDPEALVYVDGELAATGSATLELARNHSHTLYAEAADGRRASATIATTVSPVGLADIVGGIFFLVPYLGAFAPGFLTLERTEVALRLPPAVD